MPVKVQINRYSPENSIQNRLFEWAMMEIEYRFTVTNISQQLAETIYKKSKTESIEKLKKDEFKFALRPAKSDLVLWNGCVVNLYPYPMYESEAIARFACEELEDTKLAREENLVWDCQFAFPLRVLARKNDIKPSFFNMASATWTPIATHLIGIRFSLDTLEISIEQNHTPLAFTSESNITKWLENDPRVRDLIKS